MALKEQPRARPFSLPAAGTHAYPPRKQQHGDPQHAARRGAARVDVELAARVLRGQQRADAAAPAGHAHGERALHLHRGGLGDERVGVRAAQVLVAGAGGRALAASPVLCRPPACPTGAAPSRRPDHTGAHGRLGGAAR